MTASLGAARHGQRTWALVCVTIGALVGCDSHDEAADIESRSSALMGTDVGIDIPARISAADSNLLALDAMSMRTGVGQYPSAVINYQRFATTATHRIDWNVDADTFGLVRTPTRPSPWWILGGNGSGSWGFTSIYLDTYAYRFMDLEHGTNILPGFDYLTPVGSPAVLSRIDSYTTEQCAFGLFSQSGSNNVIMQSCLIDPLTGAWQDWGLDIPSFAEPTLVPLSSPQAFHRSPGDATYGASDSVWFRCGTGATVCENRMGGAGANHTFQVSLGSGALADGTRPLAIADIAQSGRFVFGVRDSGGQHNLMAWKDTAGVNAASPSYSQSWTLATGSVSSTVFSSVVPYVRADGSLAVVYFSTTSGQTTALRQRVFDYVHSTWSSASTIHDTGIAIPASFNTGAMEPVPSVVYEVPQKYGEPFLNPRNSILYRLPYSSPLGSAYSGYKDVAELMQESNGKWVKTMLPSPEEESNLYIVKTSNNTLYAADESSGASTALANTWSGATSFASDRIGLGYMIQNSGLWEVNLQDGTRRRLGSTTWSGATELTYGLEYPSSDPKLWAIQGGVLYKIDLADGSRTALGGAIWASPTSMAYLDLSDAVANLDARSLFVISESALWRVNSNTGARVQLVPANSWAGETSMAVDQSHKRLFVVGGPGNKLRNVDYNGNIVASSSTNQWTGATSISYLNGNVYVVKGSSLYKVPPGSLNTLTAIGGANWSGQTYMVPRTWQFKWNTSGGCDLNPQTLACY